MMLVTQTPALCPPVYYTGNSFNLDFTLMALDHGSAQ